MESSHPLTASFKRSIEESICHMEAEIKGLKKSIRYAKKCLLAHTQFEEYVKTISPSQQLDAIEQLDAL